MRPLSASELLDVWERGLDQPSGQRALALLAAACPETPPDVLARLSVGQRDSRLLTLREWTFGPQLACLASCPGCGEHLELAFNVEDIRVRPAVLLPEGDSEDDAFKGSFFENGSSDLTPWSPSLRGKGETCSPLLQGEGEGVRSSEGGGLALDVDGYQVRFRLPNSLDLAAISNEDVALARNGLIERCLLAVYQNGQPQAPDQLPANVMETIVERMAQADPQADVQLALSCPACGREWQTTLDVVSFFWSEINAWAYRILGEVHALASAYGWREADILAMSPWRRQVYLDMVNSGRLSE